MAKRLGKCVNFGLCSAADSRENVDVGDGGEFSCPECGKPLTQVLEAGKTTAATSGGTGKKVAAAGLLVLLLAAGGAYKFLVTDPKPEVKTKPATSLVAQTTTAPTTQTGPVMPPVTPEGPITPPPPPNVGVVTPRTVRIPKPRPVTNVAVVPVTPPAPVTPQPTTPVDPPAPPKHEDKIETPAPKNEPSSGTMVARLLSPINTKTAAVGDQFTAIIDEGPHKGAILTGKVKKLGKSKKNNEIELSFISLTKDNKTIPVKLELVDITNNQKMKGVDDEGHIIGNSSRKKGFLGGVVGAFTGAFVGKKVAGNGGMVAGLVAGGAGGYLLTAKLTSSAQDLELEPGALMTLNVVER